MLDALDQRGFFTLNWLERDGHPVASQFGITNALQQSLANAGAANQAGQFNANAANAAGAQNSSLGLQAAIDNMNAENSASQYNANALNATNWVVGGPSGAANLLGVKRSTLQSRMEKLGIRRARTMA